MFLTYACVKHTPSNRDHSGNEWSVYLKTKQTTNYNLQNADKELAAEALWWAKQATQWFVTSCKCFIWQQNGAAYTLLEFAYKASWLGLCWCGCI